MSVRIACTALVAGVAVCGSGCAAPEPTGSAAALDSESVRVMVRFRSGTPDPADPAFLQRLASRSHVSKIEMIRPMSGGAYVVEVGCGPTAGMHDDGCAAALARLRDVDPVVDVELDARVRHQPAPRSAHEAELQK